MDVVKVAVYHPEDIVQVHQHHIHQMGDHMGMEVVGQRQIQIQ